MIAERDLFLLEINVNMSNKNIMGSMFDQRIGYAEVIADRTVMV